MSIIQDGSKQWYDSFQEAMHTPPQVYSRWTMYTRCHSLSKTRSGNKANTHMHTSDLKIHLNRHSLVHPRYEHYCKVRLPDYALPGWWAFQPVLAQSPSSIPLQLLVNPASTSKTARTQPTHSLPIPCKLEAGCSLALAIATHSLFPPWHCPPWAQQSSITWVRTATIETVVWSQKIPWSVGQSGYK